MDNAKRHITIATLFLVLIGIVMVYSSTSIISSKQHGNSFYYLWKHLFTIIAGIMGMFFVSRLEHQLLRRVSIGLLIISSVMLILVFVPGMGISVNGARRWIRLWPTSFQPSEFVKLSMVIFLSEYMSRNIHRMKEFKYGIVIPLAIMLVFQIFFILQPDFGGMVNIGILTICMLFIGGARLKHLFYIVLLSIPPLVALVVSSSYRLKRIKAFLDPWQDPQGSGFQLVQSFLAFGRGYISGVGIGNSKQKLSYLPEAHTDFIFSLIGEEFGLLGVMTVIGLFIWLIIKGLSIAEKAEEPFSYYLATGLTLMIGVQVIINLAVVTGLMPTKGLPLPFVSYGGSALLINMVAIGILMNVSEQNIRMVLMKRQP